jgi:8-oxo-dGTP diphosphatase
MSKYEEQHITVDIAILTSKNETVQDLQILLIKRRDDPFKNCRAIPGGYLDRGETLLQAALRELNEETSLTEKDLQGNRVFGSPLRQFKAYGDPDRDPRCRIVSVVFYAIVPYSEKLLSAVEARDDAKEAAWFYLQTPPEKMAFDHGQILRDLFIAVIGGKIQ